MKDHREDLGRTQSERLRWRKKYEMKGEGEDMKDGGKDSEEEKRLQRMTQGRW